MRILRWIGVIVIIGILAVIVRQIWYMEAGLNDRRQVVQSADVYWSCERLPPDAVLARVYARAVLLDEGVRGTMLNWHMNFATYDLYYRMRLSHDELVEHYLRTPTTREPNCSVFDGNQA